MCLTKDRAPAWGFFSGTSWHWRQERWYRGKRYKTCSEDVDSRRLAGIAVLFPIGVSGTQVESGIRCGNHRGSVGRIHDPAANKGTAVNGFDTE